MRSFHYYRGKSHSIAVAIAWIAVGALVAVASFRIAVISSLDRGWYIAPDPEPSHWTRSAWATALFGGLCGAVLAAAWEFVRRRRPPAGVLIDGEHMAKQSSKWLVASLSTLTVVCLVLLLAFAALIVLPCAGYTMQFNREKEEARQRQTDSPTGRQ